MTEQATSALRIDGQAPAEVRLHHVWNECVGAGRANEALRADWQAHFREADLLLRPLGNTVYVMPPYCIEQADLDRVYGGIEAAIASL